MFCFDVESAVVKTPETEEDEVKGSQNRIKNAKIEWKNEVEKQKIENEKTTFILTLQV